MKNQDEFKKIWKEWLNKCIQPIQTAHKDDSVDKVIRLMLEQKVGILPLIDDKATFCGIIRATDLMCWGAVPVHSFITHIEKVPDLCGTVDHFFRYANELSAKEIMIRDDSVIVNPEMSTSQVYYIFSKISFDVIIVVDSDQKVQGAISRINFLKIFELFTELNKKRDNKIKLHQYST